MHNFFSDGYDTNKAYLAVGRLYPAIVAYCKASSLPVYKFYVKVGQLIYEIAGMQC